MKAGLVKEVREYRWTCWPKYEGSGMIRGFCSREAVIKRIGWQNLYDYVCMPVDNCHILDIKSRDERCQTDTGIKDYKGNMRTRTSN